jgi:Flp pilus assembly protein TadG
MMIRAINRPRRGIATVELVVLLPLLALLVLIAVDWGRIFYCAIVVDNCARNAAAYLNDPYATINSPYSSVTNAALADAPNLNPQPTLSTASGTDTNGTYVDCTVTYNFQTISNFPGIPRTTTITRTVRVYQAPQSPS